MGDDLGDHRVELDAHLAARLDAGVEPGKAVGRGLPDIHRARRRQEIAARILGVDACLDGVAIDGEIVLAVAEGFSFGDPQLLANQVEAGDLLRDRMLDLQTGVHFQEEELPSGKQELHRARGRVADALCRRHRGLRPLRRANLASTAGDGASSMIFW